MPLLDGDESQLHPGIAAYLALEQQINDVDTAVFRLGFWIALWGIRGLVPGSVYASSPA